MRAQKIKYIVEDGRCSGDTRDMSHGRAIEIAGPDSDREFWGVAECPIVTEIGAGAGLAGDREIEKEG